MTISLKGIHKAAVLSWAQFSAEPKEGVSEWTIQGSEASISVQLHDGTEQEKRVVKNDGEANLFFPKDYEGTVKVTITGSHSGVDTATLHIN